MCKPRFNWIDDLKIDTVVDVGASVGDFSHAVRQHWPNGTPLWQDSVFINEKLLTNGIYI